MNENVHNNHTQSEKKRHQHHRKLASIEDDEDFDFDLEDEDFDFDLKDEDFEIEIESPQDMSEMRKFLDTIRQEEADVEEETEAETAEIPQEMS